MTLEFLIADGFYEEKEEYMLYDLDSFVADIGGFMGLLLGCSVFSLYKDMASMVDRTKKKITSAV